MLLRILAILMEKLTKRSETSYVETQKVNTLGSKIPSQNSVEEPDFSGSFRPW